MAARVEAAAHSSAQERDALWRRVTTAQNHFDAQLAEFASQNCALSDKLQIEELKVLALTDQLSSLKAEVEKEMDDLVADGTAREMELRKQFQLAGGVLSTGYPVTIYFRLPEK